MSDLLNIATSEIPKEVGAETIQFLHKDIKREVKDVALSTICSILRDNKLPWNAEVDVNEILMREHIFSLNKDYVDRIRKENPGKEDSKIFSISRFAGQSIWDTLQALDKKGLIQSANEKNHTLKLTEKGIALLKQSLFPEKEKEQI